MPVGESADLRLRLSNARKERAREKLSARARCTLSGREPSDGEWTGFFARHDQHMVSTAVIHMLGGHLLLRQRVEDLCAAP